MNNSGTSINALRPERYHYLRDIVLPVPVELEHDWRARISHSRDEGYPVDVYGSDLCSNRPWDTLQHGCNRP